MSSLVSRARKQLQASALRDLLASCPLVLVYQTLGNVGSTELAVGVAAAVGKAAPNAGLAVRTARVKNSIAAAASASGMGAFFQANNILLGWQPSASDTRTRTIVINSSSSDASGSQGRSRRDDTVAELLGDFAEQRSSTGASTSSSRGFAPPLPHSALAAALDVSLKLPGRAPVALLAGFYRGQHVRPSHLAEWRSLNAAVVLPGLICQIEAAAEGLVGFESPLHALLDTLDDMQPTDLLTCLDAIGQPQEAQGAAAP
ncbi:hypothetical protein FOA52_008911 [Chlamydomonas sp. UWO 241]|nr:hypothetical protein FOA52_008911 [Chlamydomonas sp. UWO 241]